LGILEKEARKKVFKKTNCGNYSRRFHHPNGHGAMHRYHIKTTKDKVTNWQSIP